MRGKSHIQLGRYLAEKYMVHATKAQIRFFLIGCIEPDRNPATYLKGSLRAQWLRGHNYPNANRFMQRISRRLERKTKLHLFDYYTLGKLIHYTADAFTYVHNDWFSSGLDDHLEYEQDLQERFLLYLQDDPDVQLKNSRSIMQAIRAYHREYKKSESCIGTDARFALAACCCILAVLFPKPF